jgi:hypothetical protein
MKKDRVYNAHSRNFRGTRGTRVGGTRIAKPTCVWMFRACGCVKRRTRALYAPHTRSPRMARIDTYTLGTYSGVHARIRAMNSGFKA